MENNKLLNECEVSATNTLSYTLAACGYDVWLPNSRGTVYSTGHTQYNAEVGTSEKGSVKKSKWPNIINCSVDPHLDSRYWQFTLTEMAIYDLPAVITYVLRNTNESKCVSVTLHSSCHNFHANCSLTARTF